MKADVSSPVLLVCIYNKYGNVITHDYFYQMFGQYGEIVKILIFEKAKVWKTFVQFLDCQSAAAAKASLDGHVVFQDGSKMNIFTSKLKHIKLQNTNLGGVNYEQLKTQQQNVDDKINGIRNRRSTFQDHTKNSEPQSYLWVPSELNHSSNCEYQSTFSFQASGSFSNRKSVNSFNAFDIDEQFREIARQSTEFRELQREVEEGQFKTQIRKKSKTYVNNPNADQFVLQNSPSKVLFIRSVPFPYTAKCLYNIFSNFGNILRIIFMKERASGLIEFETIESTIYAKDELNYLKPQMKIFYSHYESLTLRKETEGEQVQDFKSVSSKSRSHINPPSSILYLTLVSPNYQQEIRGKFLSINCQIRQMQWKQNGKDRWMCLADLQTIDKSLLAIGLLQDELLSNGKELRLSFTRSKLSKKQSSEMK